MNLLTGILFTTLLGGTINSNILVKREIKEDTEIIVKETPYYSSNPINEAKYSKQGISLNHIGNINSVWNNYRGDGVTIAVIDGGIKRSHEDFWNGSYCNISGESASFTTDGNMYRVENNGNYDWSTIEANNSTELHGLSTSATAAATISGYGTVGIAPNATILLLKTDFWSNSSMNAVRYAVDHGADVINMSFGAIGNSSGASPYQDAINYAYSKGAIIVASAGNDNTNSSSYPASCNHVIGVGALARDSGTEKASYSNYNSNLSNQGLNVDCVAPGTVYTAVDHNYEGSWYGEMNGTSFSGPIVAGAAALFKQKYPNANQDDFEEAIKNTCDDIGEAGQDYYFGWGRLNVERLLNFGEDEEIDYQTSNLTTKVEDSTIIKWNDKQGWCYKTLHLYNVGFADGYYYSDFTNYLNIEIGQKVVRSSFNFEGSGNNWANNVEGVKGDYLINIAGNGTYEIALPWWVTAGAYQFVNNSNWKNDESCYIWGPDGRYHALLEHDVNGTEVSSKAVVANATHPFKAVTVERTLLTDSGAIIAQVSDYITCLYDILRNDMLSTSELLGDDYSLSPWFTDKACTTKFANQVLRFDAHVYAKVYEYNGSVYFQSKDWGKTYVYGYFLDNNNVLNEPLGAWPGQAMNAVDGLTFNDHGLWYCDVYLPTGRTCQLIFNNNNYQQNKEKNAVDNGYYFTTSSEGDTDYTLTMNNAIRFVKEFREAMLGVSANGNIKEASICGLSTNTINSFLARYKSLSDEEKALVDDAKIYTYKSTTDEKENVSFASMLAQLDNQTNGASTRFIAMSENGSNYLILLFSLLMTFTAFILFKTKRKAKNS